MQQFLQAFTLKRAILVLIAAGLLALELGNFGLLGGRRSVFYPAEFTTSNTAFVRVTCNYLTGFNSLKVSKSGAPGTVTCPWLQKLEG